MATTMTDVLARARSKIAENSNRKERPSKPPAGKSTWRILPGWRKGDPLNFVHFYGQHWVKDLDGNIKAVVVCPSKTYDQKCDICDAVWAAVKAAPDDATREAIKESKSSQRYLVNAYQPEVGGKAVILELGASLFESLLNSLDEYPNMLDASGGQDVIISREGTGMTTKYSLTVRSAAKSKDVPKSVIMSLHDLDEYVKEDFETKKLKALETLGDALDGGVGTASAALTPSRSHKAIAGPTGDGVNPPDLDMSAEIDDEIPDSFDDAEIIEDEDETPEAATKSSDTFGADVDDADLDDLLKDL